MRKSLSSFPPKKKGRPAKDARHRETGGRNPIPRSYGLVLESIRKSALKLDDPQAMREVLDRVESRFHPRKSKHPDGDIGALVRSWETAASEPQFAYEWRYARIVGSYSGVLHLASVIYYHWREAEKAESDARRHELLEANRQIAQGLRSLADFVDADNSRMLGCEGGCEGEPHPHNPEDELSAHLDRALQILQAYCKGAGTSIEIPNEVVTASIQP